MLARISFEITKIIHNVYHTENMYIHIERYCKTRCCYKCVLKRAHMFPSILPNRRYDTDKAPIMDNNNMKLDIYTVYVNSLK